MSDSEKLYGPEGYIVHWSSGKLVHPKGGSFNPVNDTRLVLHSGAHGSGSPNLRVRFVAVPDAGHFGYIEHVPSKKIVHPRGGSLTPKNDTPVVYHSDQHAAALFAFDEVNNRIVHRGGKFWHPKGGSPNPGNDTSVVLHDQHNDATRFHFVNTSMERVSFYPSPNLSGDWRIVNAVLDSKATHTKRFTYTIGKSTTLSTTMQTAWSLTAKMGLDLFSSAGETFSAFVQLADNQTWKDEQQYTTEIKVGPGKTVVTWQYTFGAEQYGEKVNFQSSILEDTNSMSVKPTLDVKQLARKPVCKL